MPEVTVWPRPNGLPIASTTVADLEPVGVAERHGGQAAARRSGAPRCRSPDRCRPGAPEVAPVLERHLDLGGVGDDVAVGQDVAARGVDDHARARALHLALARHRRQVEEAPEERVVEQADWGRARPGERTAMLTTPGVTPASSGAMVSTPRAGSRSGPAAGADRPAAGALGGLPWARPARTASGTRRAGREASARRASERASSSQSP